MLWGNDKKKTRHSYKELKVKDLTTLESDIKANPTILLIHMDGCWHCQTFKPVFDSFAKTMKKTVPQVRVLGIEASVLTKLMETNKKLASMIVTAPGSPKIYFPKVIAFKPAGDKTPTKKEFDGERTEEALMKFTKAYFRSVLAKAGGDSYQQEFKKIRQQLNEQIFSIPSAHNLPQKLEKVLQKYVGI